MDDLGVEVRVLVNTVSSAAKSAASRRGAGQVRHIEVQVLWIQGRAAKSELTIAKVRGISNVAGALTKHVERHNMDERMKVCGVVRRSEP